MEDKPKLLAEVLAALVMETHALDLQEVLQVCTISYYCCSFSYVLLNCFKPSVFQIAYILNDQCRTLKFVLK